MPCGDAQQQQVPPVHHIAAGHNKSPFASLESSSGRVGLRVCSLGIRACTSHVADHTFTSRHRYALPLSVPCHDTMLCATDLTLA